MVPSGEEDDDYFYDALEIEAGNVTTLLSAGTPGIAKAERQLADYLKRSMW